MTINLNDPFQRKQLSTKILADINSYAVKAYSDGFRNHLGASLIGRPCSRFLWYVFRWTFHPPMEFDGRMQRLLNRGNLEELRYAEYLKGIGANVTTHTPNGEQIRVSGVDGHFGGSLDGVATLPWIPNITFIAEFKTKGTGAGFTAMVKEGVKKENSDHYTQMSVYGYKMNYEWALYFVTNKNDDDMHVEIVQLDHRLGAAMEEKARVIIYSEKPPSRLGASIVHTVCKYCDANKVCHMGAMYEKNCRSCVNAFPIPDKQWACRLYDNMVIPADFIPKGCEKWTPNV